MIREFEYNCINNNIDYRKYMEQSKGKINDEDGWDNLSHSSEESVKLISLYRHDQGRPILEQQYSL